MKPVRRKQLVKGMHVDVQVDNRVVRGIFKKVLPSKSSNKEIIDIELMTGTKGILIRAIPKSELKKEAFIFFNLFFNSKFIFTIWDKYTKETFIIKSYSQRLDKEEKTAFLFSDEDLAHEVLLELKQDNLAVRRISRQKLVVENFENEDISSFRLNEDRQVVANKLSELEKFHNLFNIFS